jgi:hypothetical protein
VAALVGDAEDVQELGQEPEGDQPLGEVVLDADLL